MKINFGYILINIDFLVYIFFLGNGDFLKKRELIVSMLFWLYIYNPILKYNWSTNFYGEIIGQTKTEMGPFIYHVEEVY